MSENQEIVGPGFVRCRVLAPSVVFGGRRFVYGDLVVLPLDVAIAFGGASDAPGVSGVAILDRERLGLDR